MKNLLLINWDPEAIENLRQAWIFISNESPIDAEKVVNEITSSIGELPPKPKRYPADRFKISNPGEYREFEKLGFRIAYKISEAEIIILRIRHIKQEPLEY